MHDSGRFGDIEWAVVTEPLAGQPVSGDHWVVRDVGDGAVLAAVADGLGHGPEAAGAARLVDDVLSQYHGEQPDRLLRRCHRALSGSRGAAVSVGRLQPDERCVVCAGVGNVCAGVIGTRPEGVGWLANPPADAGIVGARMPGGVRVNPLVMRVGDLFVLATDGVATALPEHVRLGLPIDEIARALFDGAARTDRDDALVLVCRIRGASR
ncbi:SpoIIE family protein phosphatase [Rhodococcus sp. D2-41]|uniref:SpoIIE family protein phosphatase n=1 Tax=Speluncibacter jeojiensis TaxID=2710754 RepID=UPI002410204F|nr:SpoIIE family protein phosphatase [Rhodococcus sp. D2-41]MDG3010778.1 SpoIIE family protein phosphatase [Rhodococcus sp. D2-41]